MQVYNRLTDVPELRDVILTIGTFDGVHKGHQQLLFEIVKKAKAINGTSVLLTFDPHPRMVLQPDAQEGIKLLTTVDERLSLLEKTGLDVVVIVPFSVEFANLDAEVYVEDVVIKHFHPKEIVMGYDHQFGRDRKGNFELLKSLEDKFGYKLSQIDQQTLDKITYSSTIIRTALEQGEVAKANLLLGYHYSIEGVVAHGDKRGRKIGFPTANIQVLHQEKLIPANGVYIVKTRIGTSIFNGMLNIGTRPTFRGESKTIENHLFDFDETIYGHPIETMFYEYLRPEKNFENKDDLVAQLKKDKENALKILSKFS